MLHALQKHGLAAAEQEHNARYGLSENARSDADPPRFRDVLRGKISYLRAIKGSDDEQVRKIVSWAHKIDAYLAAPIEERATLEALAATVNFQRPSVGDVRRPSGTLAIFFSDIKDSTVENERLGDHAWQSIRQEHDAIVRRNLRIGSGFEVKTMGDGFMATFQSTKDAVRTASAIQSDMAARNVIASVPVKVRIGIHVGEPLSEGDDIFGHDVNFASRVASAAEGGEVLVSERAHAIVEPSKEFEFRALIPRPLKNIPGEHVLWKLLQ